MPKKLLVADDSVTIHKVVTLTFADEDVVIETATDGAKAIESAKRIKPDFVLADVFMPGRNGYEVCESLKSDPELAGVPVILMVGTFEAFDEGRPRASNVTAILPSLSTLRNCCGCSGLLRGANLHPHKEARAATISGGRALSQRKLRRKAWRAIRP